MPETNGLTERSWRNLLREIQTGRVIPVIGSEVTTIDLGEGSILLEKMLAPQLAAELKLLNPNKFVAYNDVARQFFFGGGDRRELYTVLGELIDRLSGKQGQHPVGQPGDSLTALASITDFELYITTTPDPMLVRAMIANRPEFSTKHGILRFHPQGNPNGRGSADSSLVSACDLSIPFQGPVVYHILGDYDTFPDFAIWEEDYMEFISGLIACRTKEQLENLFRYISDRSLLFLGAPSEDWVLRFFLRAARGGRLSANPRRDYIADQAKSLGESLIFFFDKTIRATTIIDGCPQAFIAELEKRWRTGKENKLEPQEFLDSQLEVMPRDSVFISYAREDFATASLLGQCLSQAGIPVWMDKHRLGPGQNFETQLEYAVKDSASFFLSLISRSTEKDHTRFVHREREWAAQRHSPGYVYYVPVVIDDILDSEISLEPKCFEKIHRERPVSLDAAGFKALVNKVRGYVDQHRRFERPRS